MSLSYEKRHRDLVNSHGHQTGGGAFTPIESFLELEDSTGGTPSYMVLESDPGTNTDLLKLEDSI